MARGQPWTHRASGDGPDVITFKFDENLAWRGLALLNASGHDIVTVALLREMFDAW
jgi:hypothetical protein